MNQSMRNNPASRFRANKAAFPTVRIVAPQPAFDADAFLRSAAVGQTVTTYSPADVIFGQGDAADSVMYVQKGAVKLSVLSHKGKEAVVAILESGDFFGESALTGRADRPEGAIAMTTTTVLILLKQQMIRLLQDQRVLSDRFIAHVLARNIRIEEDLIDQIFNCSEKRLARILLLLTHCGKPGEPHGSGPAISQQTLADMIGTTRSRVNSFMNKFKRLGLIEYSHHGVLKINDSLLTVILDDEGGGGARDT